MEPINASTTTSKYDHDMEKGTPLQPTISTDNHSGTVSPVCRLDPSGNPLSPTPTASSFDPLNWSLGKKYVCIGIACYYYFLMTYFTTAPIPSFALLQEQFDATYNQVNWTFALSTLGLAVGPLWSAGLADTYGRRIVSIVSTIIALVATGCTGIKSQSLGAYMAERFLQGLGAGAAANLGLSIIIDVSFEHERGYRVGLWTIAANLGTLLGGVFGGFFATINQFWVPYHVAMAFGLLLVLEIFCLPETLFPRHHMLSLEQQQHHQHGTSSPIPTNSTKDESDESAPIPLTTQLPYINLRKIPGLHHPQPWTPLVVFCKLWTYPTVTVAIMAYVFSQYWWILAVMTMEPDAYATESLQVQGLLYIGLLVGVLVAEVCCSGALSDKLMLRLTRRNGGVRHPEMRLWLGYPAAVVTAVGLVVWGCSVEREWHWMTGQAGFFLFALGLQAGNTVLCTYITDNYPDFVNELTMFYSVIINMSAFLVPWFIYDWVEKDGYAWTFSIQAIICVVGVIPAYALLQKYGVRWRKEAKFGYFT